MPTTDFHPLHRIGRLRSRSLMQEGNRRATALGARSFAILALLMSGVVATGTARAADSSEAAKQDAEKQAAEKQEAAKREAWRESLSQAPLTKKGCYRATYPDAAWHEVPCLPKRTKPFLPRTAGERRPDIVGAASNDISAGAPSGHISRAIGAFDSFSATSVTSVPPTSTCSGSAAGGANTFSLQLNANPTQPSPQAAICQGGSPQCTAWQQFVYFNEGTGGQLFMQYWLINYGTAANQTCPAGGWMFYDNVNYCNHPPTHQYDCYQDNAMGPVAVSNVFTSIGDLGKLSVHATATPGGTDTARLFSAGVQVAGAAVVDDDTVANLSQFWTAAEFNVFGDGGGSQANFNSGATVVPRTQITYGGTAAPQCLATSFTGETNNLSLGPKAPAKTGPGPAVFFTESSAGGASPLCAAASSIGDTHVHPFNGATEYDFQAYGDFLLVEAGPDFMVHTRQTQGPPNYPGTATNTAVAVMMGRTRVAVYLQPARLVIDGKTNDLADGKTVTVPGGVQVARHGAEYRISDDSGNQVIADLVTSGSEPLWITVYVSLGRAPDKSVRGLLGNPDDKADEITTAKGAVLKVPVDVKDLYGQFADGWRIDPAKSLFVELPPAPRGAPAKPLTAADLTAAEKAHAEQACKAAGVTNEALLGDCVLDATVLKDDAAVKVFTKIAAPKLVLTLK